MLLFFISSFPSPLPDPIWLTCQNHLPCSLSFVSIIFPFRCPQSCLPFYTRTNTCLSVCPFLSFITKNSGSKYDLSYDPTTICNRIDRRFVGPISSFNNGGRVSTSVTLKPGDSLHETIERKKLRGKWKFVLLLLLQLQIYGCGLLLF